MLTIKVQSKHLFYTLSLFRLCPLALTDLVDVEQRLQLDEQLPLVPTDFLAVELFERVDGLS